MMTSRTFAGALMLLIVFFSVPNAVLAFGQLLGSDATADALLRIDPATAAVTTIGPLGDPIVSSLTYDRNHRILYGASSITDNLLRIDPNSGATTVIGNFGVGLVHAIEYDANEDVLYGVSNLTDQLYTINTLTGAATAVGPTSLLDVGGLAYDADNRVMYATDMRQSVTNALFTIDLSTGMATIVGPYNNPSAVQITGLAWDPVGGGLFGSDNKSDPNALSDMFTIDAATGQATLIATMDIPRNILGLTFVPEPSTSIVMIVGVACLALARRRAFFRPPVRSTRDERMVDSAP